MRLRNENVKRGTFLWGKFRANYTPPECVYIWPFLFRPFFLSFFLPFFLCVSRPTMTLSSVVSISKLLNAIDDRAGRETRRRTIKRASTNCYKKRGYLWFSSIGFNGQKKDQLVRIYIMGTPDDECPPRWRRPLTRWFPSRPIPSCIYPQCWTREGEREREAGE